MRRTTLSGPLLLALLLALILALSLLVPPGGTGRRAEAAPAPAPAIAEPAARGVSPGLRPLAPGRPPRNDAAPRDLRRQQVYVTTTVDTDRDGRKDVVRVVVTRPRAALVDGRRLAVVGQASPYFSCCGEAPNHDVDVPLHGPRADFPDAMLSGFDSEGLTWARRGYGYARIASLGSNRSTGCPTVGDRAETAGVKAYVDWLNGRAVGRTPDGTRVRAGWSTGNTSLIGVSYDGTLPNMVAATGVEGLRAIVPVSAISSWYDYYRQDGLVVAPGGYQGEDVDVLARFDYTRADQDICDPVIDSLERRQDRTTGDHSPFWAARDLLPRAAKVRAGVLVVHGFGDTNVKPSQAARWYAALRRAKVPAKIWWDQGGHGTTIPDALVTRWFDHFLYGERNGVERGDRAWVLEGGTTRRYATWPSPRASPTTYTLGARRGGSVGVLRAGGSGGRATESFIDNPTINATEQCRQARPAYALGYRTAPLGRVLRLSGTPTTRLRLAYDAHEANLTVALCAGDELLTQGWADPQNRRSLSRTDPLVPGRAYDLRVRLQPVDRTIAKGTRLSLVVMASDSAFTIRPPGPGVGVSLDLRTSMLSLPVVR